MEFLLPNYFFKSVVSIKKCLKNHTKHINNCLLLTVLFLSVELHGEGRRVEQDGHEHTVLAEGGGGKRPQPNNICYKG